MEPLCEVLRTFRLVQYTLPAEQDEAAALRSFITSRMMLGAMMRWHSSRIFGGRDVVVCARNNGVSELAVELTFPAVRGGCRRPASSTCTTGNNTVQKFDEAPTIRTL